MYTSGDDVPLPEIFENAKKVYDGNQVDVKAMQKEGTLREECAKVLPDFDRDRVYDGDIRKFFTWYNLLLQAGITTFTAPKEETAEEQTAE